MNSRTALPQTAGEAMIADLERFKPDGLSLNAWAVGAGVNRAVWGDIRRHGNPSRRTLEKLLTYANSSLAEFEALRVGTQPANALEQRAEVRDPSTGWNAGAPADIPLMAATVGPVRTWDGGSTTTIWLKGAVTGHVERPFSLRAQRGLYGFCLPVATMWPRYRQGRTLIVAPALPVEPGDDVLLRIDSPTAAFKMIGVIGEWVAADETSISVRQFNPAAKLTFDRGDVAAVHRVVGEAI